MVCLYLFLLNTGVLTFLIGRREVSNELGVINLTGVSKTTDYKKIYVKTKKGLHLLILLSLFVFTFIYFVSFKRFYKFAKTYVYPCVHTHTHICKCVSKI